MNKIIKITLFYFLVLFTNFSSCSLDQLGKLFNVEQLAQAKTFATQIEKEVEGLKKRKSEHAELYKIKKSELETIQTNIETLREKSKELSGSELNFTSKYLMILNQTAQTLTEIEQLHQQIISIIEANIKLLQEFKEDPEFKSKSFRLSSKSIYSIDDLQKISDLLVQYDTKIKEFEEKLKKSSLDIEQRKKALNLAKLEYEEKKKEQKEFKSKDSVQEEQKEQSEFTVSQKAQILDAEERLLKYKKDLAELKVQEVEQKRQLLETEFKIAKIQLEIINNEYDRIKSELHIDEKDLKKAEEALNQQIQDSSKKQEEIAKKLEAIEQLKSKELLKISQLKKKYKLTDAQITQIKDWTLQPTKLNMWTALTSIGKITNYINYELDIIREKLIAKIDYKKAELNDKEIDNLIINTWYKLTTGKFNGITQEEALTKEIKIYEKRKADILATNTATSDKQLWAVSMLNENSRISENIKSRMAELKEQKETTFKNNQTEYSNLLVALKEEAYENSSKRNESITQLIERYNAINNIRKLGIKKIDTIIDELKTRLQSIGVPVLWKGLKDFIPDVKRFFNYIYEKGAKQLIYNNKQTFKNLVNYYTEHSYALISLLLQIIIIFIVFMLINLYMPDIIKLLELISPNYGIGHNISNFFIVTFKFISRNLTWFFLWTIFFLAIRYKFIPDNYTGIIFYLISIPIWLFLAYRYIRFLERTNTQRDYFLISKEYQRRFLIIFSIVLCLSIIIIFFREAFILAKFTKSDVPTTLQALNFIILQIGLIFILSKEQILRLIPKTTALWQWIYEQIEKYYYLFLAGLIFIIIMSNPYLGYGPKFFYIVSRIGLILLLIPFVSAIHNRIKKFSTSIFFYSDSENIRERFPYARTAYGIFVIASFVFFVALAIIIAANIWGYKIGFEKLYDLLHKEIYPYIDPYTGKHISINILDFGRVALWVVAGIASAYIINRFILGRIFDLLLVNVGIQNAIISLVRYIIIVSALIIGLKSIGMGSVLNYILIILAGLGVAGKELITDLIGYFIILIQRPIKIGDFVRIDEDVNGVVRHITLRSVILRRKNSVTVIVPNSQVMSKPVVNWNYSRSYFAFDDIFITTSYDSEPDKAKDLMLKVLDNNINILKNPAPVVWLNNFTDNGYQFLIRGYISFDRVLEQWQIASDIRLELVKVLRANNIEVAAPTRLLRVIDKDKFNTNLSNIKSPEETID